MRIGCAGGEGCPPAGGGVGCAPSTRLAKEDGSEIPVMHANGHDLHMTAAVLELMGR